MPKGNKHTSLDELARMVARGFQATGKDIKDVRTDVEDVRKQMATKDDLAQLRVEVRGDVDVLLDRHFGTYMQRYDERRDKSNV